MSSRSAASHARSRCARRDVTPSSSRAAPDRTTLRIAHRSVPGQTAMTVLSRWKSAVCSAGSARATVTLAGPSRVNIASDRHTTQQTRFPSPANETAPCRSGVALAPSRRTTFEQVLHGREMPELCEAALMRRRVSYSPPTLGRGLQPWELIQLRRRGYRAARCRKREVAGNFLHSSADNVCPKVPPDRRSPLVRRRATADENNRAPLRHRGRCMETIALSSHVCQSRYRKPPTRRDNEIKLSHWLTDARLKP